MKRFQLGAHTPELSADDIDRIHRLWVDAVKSVGSDIHHRDIVTAALASLERDLASARRQEALDHLRSYVSQSA